jgi:hypothetical protein
VTAERPASGTRATRVAARPGAKRRRRRPDPVATWARRLERTRPAS